MDLYEFENCSSSSFIRQSKFLYMNLIIHIITLIFCLNGLLLNMCSMIVWWREANGIVQYELLGWISCCDFIQLIAIFLYAVIQDSGLIYGNLNIVIIRIISFLNVFLTIVKLTTASAGATLLGLVTFMQYVVNKFSTVVHIPKTVTTLVSLILFLDIMLSFPSGRLIKIKVCTPQLSIEFVKNQKSTCFWYAVIMEGFIKPISIYSIVIFLAILLYTNMPNPEVKTEKILLSIEMSVFILKLNVVFAILNLSQFAYLIVLLHGFNETGENSLYILCNFTHNILNSINACANFFVFYSSSKNFQSGFSYFSKRAIFARFINKEPLSFSNMTPVVPTKGNILRTNLNQ